MDSLDLLTSCAQDCKSLFCARETLAHKWGFKDYLQTDVAGALMLDLSWCGGLIDPDKSRPWPTPASCPLPVARGATQPHGLGGLCGQHPTELACAGCTHSGTLGQNAQKLMRWRPICLAVPYQNAPKRCRSAWMSAWASGVVCGHSAKSFAVSSSSSSVAMAAVGESCHTFGPRRVSMRARN
jgi:hypothetical protein